MELVWWEAAELFLLWAVQFALSPVTPSPGFWGFLAGHIHVYVTVAYFVLAGVEIVRLISGRRNPPAFQFFIQMWRQHVKK
jgi:hypothetical protein